MKKEMTEREERVEHFKTAATFGFLAAAMFSLGGPLILVFAPGLDSCFRKTLILAGGVAGFLIVASVLVFYFLLVWKFGGPDT